MRDLARCTTISIGDIYAFIPIENQCQASLSVKTWWIELHCNNISKEQGLGLVLANKYDELTFDCFTKMMFTNQVTTSLNDSEASMCPYNIYGSWEIIVKRNFRS